MRGNPDQPSVASTLDPRAASNWLSFSGGQHERNSGVVDAFTGKQLINTDHLLINSDNLLQDTSMFRI